MENISISTKQGNRIKQKASWFCGATKKQDDIDNIVKNIVEFPFYAYIFHDSDDECADKHIHFLINIRGSRSIKSIAESLNCDYGVVQKCQLPRSYARYLIHLDDKLKVQYNKDCVITNNLDRYCYFLTDNVVDSSNLYYDYCLLREGRISASEFIENYRSEFANLNFYQKIRIFSELDSVSKIV